MTPAALTAVLSANKLRAPHTRAEITPRFANAPKLEDLTLDGFLSECDPCWKRDGRESELRALWGARKTATALDVALAFRDGDLGATTGEEAIWVVTCPAWYVHPEKVLRWLASDFAASVLHFAERVRPGDLRSRHGIEAARQFALDMIDDAARDDARDAAWAAAWAAAMDDARDAAWAAAWAAAMDAARDAAWDAAWDAQIDRVISVLSGGA